MIRFKTDVKLQLELSEGDPADNLPGVSIFVLDSNDKVLCKTDAENGAQIKLPAKALNASERVLVTRLTDELDADALATAQSLSRSYLARVDNTTNQLQLSRRRWEQWLPLFQICVDGNVRKCWSWPVIRQAQLDRRRIFSNNISVNLARTNLFDSENTALEPSATSDLTLFPLYRCRPVCEGIVEVYERICCTRIFIDPPFLEEICEILKGRLREIPDFPIPPPVLSRTAKIPDIPFAARKLFNKGAIDPVNANAAADLNAISSLSFEQAQEYVQARPYLLHLIHSCGEPVRRGASAIGISGEFSICYTASPYFIVRPNTICRREVAYRVSQLTSSGLRVIYDGVASGNWFDPDDSVTLDSYDPLAIACDPPTTVPGPDGAYVALAQIGSTDSVELESPDQSSAFSVAGPPLPANAGLAFPDSDFSAAKGQKKNLNWGGVLPILLDFSKGMEATVAEYYRISIVRANSAGAPIESTRQYLDDAVTWFYNDPVLVGTDLTVEKRSLPLTSTTDPTFHKIPYDKLIPSDAEYRPNQYHGFVDTTDFNGGVGRHLLTVEIYDASFNRVIPNAAFGVTGDVAEAFSYETWNDPLFTTSVPFGALTHLFWWDNRPLVTVIEDLRKNGSASTEECQFLQKESGDSDASFSSGFRAYHPQHDSDIDFMFSWQLKWKRGLGGAQDTLDSGIQSEGFGTDPKVSAFELFSVMLNQGLAAGESNSKCTFSLLLSAGAKTWNGSSYLYPNSVRDVASFALDIS